MVEAPYPTWLFSASKATNRGREPKKNMLPNRRCTCSRGVMPSFSSAYSSAASATTPSLVMARPPGNALHTQPCNKRR
jgi:hypothetical protein